MKSHKDKTWDTMLDSIVRIKNAIKNNDWSIIQDEYENVNKQVEKAKMLISKEGLPKFYVKMMVDVEDFLLVSLKDKEGMKKMKPPILKALNRMKLTVKKHNKTYETEIADYRAHPEKYQEDVTNQVADSDDSDDDDDDSDEDDDEDEDEDESEDEDEDEDESDEEEVPAKAKAPKVKVNRILQYFS